MLTLWLSLTLAGPPTRPPALAKFPFGVSAGATVTLPSLRQFTIWFCAEAHVLPSVRATRPPAKQLTVPSTVPDGLQVTEARLVQLSSFPPSFRYRAKEPTHCRAVKLHELSMVRFLTVPEMVWNRAALLPVFVSFSVRPVILWPPPS